MKLVEAGVMRGRLFVESENLTRALTSVRTLRILSRAKRLTRLSKSQDEIWRVIRGAAIELFEDVEGITFAALRGGVIELDHPLAELKKREKTARNKGHVGRVIGNRKAHYEPCLEADDPHFERGTFAAIGTVLTLPIQCDLEDVPGAIQLRSTRKDGFPDGDVRKAFQRFVGWAGNRAVLTELRRALRDSQLHLPEKGIDWRQDILDLLLGSEAELSRLLRTKWEVERRLAEELKRIGGEHCVAASVRVYNAQSDDLSYVVCLGEAWTPEAREKAYDIGSQYDMSKAASSSDALASDSVVTLRRKKSAARRALLQKDYVYYDTVEGTEYDPVLQGTKSLWAKRFMVNETVRGVVSVDWDVAGDGPLHIQQRLDAMVIQFEVVLNALAGKEELVYRRIERSVRSNDEEGLVKVTREIAEIFDAGHCDLFVDRNASEELRLLASTFRVDAREILRRNYPFGEGITGWVAKNKKTLCLRDPHDEDEVRLAAERQGVLGPPQHTRYPNGTQIKGLLAAPMVARGRVIGVVQVTDFLKTEFAHEAEAFLQEIANRLGQELDRIWIEEDAKSQMARLQHWPLDLEDSLQAAIDETAEFTNAAGAYIRLLDRQHDLEVFQACGLLQPFRDRSPLPFEVKPMIAANIWLEDSWGEFRRPILAKFGPQARDLISAGAILQLVPKSVEGLDITLCLVFRVAQKWMGSSAKVHPDDTIDRVKSRVEAAILPALRLARVERKLKDELRASQSLLEAHTGATTVAEVAEAFYKSALDQSGLDVGAVRLFDAERNVWRRGAPVRVEEKDNQIFPDELPSNNALRRCMNSNSPVFERDVQQLPEWKIDWENETNSIRREFLMSVRSSVAIPLWDGPQFIGGIFLESKHVVLISEDTMRHLTLLAPIAAKALHSAMIRQKRLDLAEPFAMVGTMLGSFLHQQRNALSAAKAFCDNIQQMKGLPHAAHERLEKLERALKAAGTVCRDIACVNLHDQAAPERLSLNDLVDEAWGNLSGGIDLAGFEVKRFYDSRRPLVLGNRVQIETAIRMLIQNALESLGDARAQKLIRLETKVRHGRTTFRIADSGCGMDEATRKQAFRPFFTTKPTGSGLGLAIVDWVARGHGAKVNLTSRPGWGTSTAIRFHLEGFGDDQLTAG